MPSDFISLRKHQLRHHIYEAQEFGENDQILWLRSQWVHRYGIDGLQELEKQEEVISSKTDFSNNTNIIENTFQEVKDGLIEEKTEYQISVIEEENSDSDDLHADNDSDSKELLNQKIKGVDRDEITKVESKQKKDSYIVQSPPIHSINNFRKWLPSLENNLPKAS